MKKLKFFEDVKINNAWYYKGMQYPIEQIGEQNANEIVSAGCGIVYPLSELELESIEPTNPITKKPTLKKSNRKGDINVNT